MSARHTSSLAILVDSVQKPTETRTGNKQQGGRTRENFRTGEELVSGRETRRTSYSRHG